MATTNRVYKTLAALTTSVANVLNCAITSLSGPVGITLTQPRVYLRHIRVVNKTSGAQTFSFWVGATGASAAGTEFAFGINSVPANGYVDWFGNFPLESTDFLTGSTSANTSLTVNIASEVGFS